jgi:hypothetical protein
MNRQDLINCLVAQKLQSGSVKPFCVCFAASGRQVAAAKQPATTTPKK